MKDVRKETDREKEREAWKRIKGELEIEKVKASQFPCFLYAYLVVMARAFMIYFL